MFKNKCKCQDKKTIVDIYENFQNVRSKFFLTITNGFAYVTQDKLQ